MDRDFWRPMPRRPSTHLFRGVASALILFVVAIGLIFLLLWLQSSDKTDCENRGGVWLFRESACVSGPPGG